MATLILARADFKAVRANLNPYVGIFVELNLYLFKSEITDSTSSAGNHVDVIDGGTGSAGMSLDNGGNGGDKTKFGEMEGGVGFERGGMVIDGIECVGDGGDEARSKAADVIELVLTFMAGMEPERLLGWEEIDIGGRGAGGGYEVEIEGDEDSRGVKDRREVDLVVGPILEGKG
jgi:hypothetical protein